MRRISATATAATAVDEESSTEPVATYRTMNSRVGTTDSATPRGPPIASATENSSPCSTAPSPLDGAGSSRLVPACSVGTSREDPARSEEHTSELQSRGHLVCRLLLEK